jgi:RNA polymerase sigma factor (sigma-70 family)
MRPEDRRDAQQQVFFAFCEAVRTFDPARIRAGQKNPFQVFLFQVARRRFRNFARSVERVRKHSGQSLDTVPGLDSQACQLPGLLGCDTPPSRVGRDPVLIAQENEEEERLAAAAEQLTVRQRRVWPAIRQGTSLQEIAQQFGVTYACAWNWRQQIIAALREAVKDKSEKE